MRASCARLLTVVDAHACRSDATGLQKAYAKALRKPGKQRTPDHSSSGLTDGDTDPEKGLERGPDGKALPHRCSDRVIMTSISL